MWRTNWFQVREGSEATLLEVCRSSPGCWLRRDGDGRAMLVGDDTFEVYDDSSDEGAAGLPCDHVYAVGWLRTEVLEPGTPLVYVWDFDEGDDPDRVMAGAAVATDSSEEWMDVDGWVRGALGRMGFDWREQEWTD